MCAYMPEQVKVILPFLKDSTKWFLLGGPADGVEAQVLHSIRPDMKFIGFEPNPGFFELQKGMNFPGQLLPIGLWNEPGELSMWEGDDCTQPQFQNMRCSSFTRPGKGMEHKAIVSTLDILSEEHGPFDSSFLWIDIEGSELQCLQGAAGLLSRGCIKGVNLEAFASDLPEIASFLAQFHLREVEKWNMNTRINGDVRVDWFNVIYVLEG